MTIGSKKNNLFTLPANSFDPNDAPNDFGTACGAHVDDTSGGCLITG